MLIGNAISVVRCSKPTAPFVPSDLGNMGLWLDAADSATVTLVSGAVSQWNDKSGAGKNAVQGTPTKRPTYTSSLLNGKGGLTYDGIDDCMPVASYATKPFISVFIVTKTTNAKPFFMEQGTDVNSVDGFYILGTNAYAGATRRAANLNYALGPVNWLGPNDEIISYVTTSTPAVSGSIFSFWRSGNTVALTQSTGTTVADTTTTATLNIGSRNNGALIQMSGNLHEVIFYNAELSTTNRQKVEGYLAHKWGLTANLPVTHPYKTVAP